MCRTVSGVLDVCTWLAAEFLGLLSDLGGIPRTILSQLRAGLLLPEVQAQIEVLFGGAAAGQVSQYSKEDLVRGLQAEVCSCTHPVSSYCASKAGHDLECISTCLRKVGVCKERQQQQQQQQVVQ